VRQERRSGRFSFDLALVSPTPALAEGRAEGLWAPIRLLLFHADVLDDRAWRDGLNARYMDAGGDLSFNWEYQVVHAYAINTDFVQEGEIKTARDLLDPKWQGKILSLDPRLGTGLLSAASVANTWGTDLVKQLVVDQQPIFSRAGPSQITEALVHGRHPIALGVRPKALNEFRARGLGNNVSYLDLADTDFVATNSCFYFDRAPHPAAAKLFANWILTVEAQTLLTSGLITNSARTDVEAFEPDGIATAGKNYYEPDREANYQQIADTRSLMYHLLGTGVP
jgi:iron(III) transport system substrate-binding protein